MKTLKLPLKKRLLKKASMNHCPRIIIVSFLFLISIPLFAQDIIAEAKQKLNADENQKVIDFLHSHQATQGELVEYNQILGISYQRLKKTDKAIKYLIKCTEKDRLNSKCFYLLGSNYIDKLNNTENIFQKGSIASKVKKYLLKAIELEPSHVDARILLSNYYMNSPLIAGGSQTKAKFQANEVIKYNPIKGNKLLASIAMKNKSYDLAEKYYLKVYELNSNDQNIRFSLASLYYETKDYDQAFKFAQASIDKFPDYLRGYYQYAKIASIAGKNIEQAKSYINYFIKNHTEKSFPKKHWGYYRQALLQNLSQQKPQAQESLVIALQLKPNFESALDLLEELNQ